MHHAFKLGDIDYAVALSRGVHTYQLHFDSRTLAVTLHVGLNGDGWLRIDGRTVPVVVASRGDDIYVHLDGAAYQLRYEHPLERLAHQGQGALAMDKLRAPMPGSLITVHVAAGQRVVRGEALLVMESMKMETTLVASHDGVVGAVHFSAGQSFDRDAVLLSFEAPDSP